MAQTYRRKNCAFCRKKVVDIDYKEPLLLTRYLSSWSRIKAAKETGTCARHQRQLSEAIKRARYLALMPYFTR